MRTELCKMDGQRTRFRAIVARFGEKRGWEGRTEKTVLLTDVTHIETENVVTDHLWFNYTKGFNDAKIEPGCIVEFDARVGVYKKGYKGKREGVRHWTDYDYRLERPTKIMLVKSGV